jgi:hypothetical protein
MEAPARMRQPEWSAEKPKKTACTDFNMYASREVLTLRIAARNGNERFLMALRQTIQ